MASVKGRWVTHRRLVSSTEHALRDLENHTAERLNSGGVSRIYEVVWPDGYNPLSTEKPVTIVVEPVGVAQAAYTVDEYDERVLRAFSRTLLQVGVTVGTLVDKLLEDAGHIAISTLPQVSIQEVEDKERGEIGFLAEVVVGTVRKVPLKAPTLAPEKLKANPTTLVAEEVASIPDAILELFDAANKPGIVTNR